MTVWLKQSTAVDVVLGPFIDDTDGKTPETALTISQADCQLTKNGGAVAQKNNATAASHLGGGHYKVPFSTTDTNTLGHLRLYVNEAGALPCWRDFMVVPANVYDSFFSTDKLQVHVDEMTAGIITATVLADNAITAAKLAADAITAAKVAADVGAEIADAVWDEALAGHATAGSAGKALSDTLAAAPPSAAAIADAVLDEALSGHTAAGSAGKALADAGAGNYISGSATAATNAARGFQGLVTAKAVTGTLTTAAFTTDLTEATTDHYKGRTITFTSGVLAGQQREILAYNGTTKTISVAAMTDAPANNDEFSIA